MQRIFHFICTFLKSLYHEGRGEIWVLRKCCLIIIVILFSLNLNENECAIDVKKKKLSQLPQTYVKRAQTVILGNIPGSGNP